jgi:antitoxin YefM
MRLVTPRSISERRWLNSGAGRTWSAASSWALLGELSGQSSTGLSPSTVARIRRRIRTSTAEDIARRVASRTVAHRHTADSIAKTASELVLTGRSAADVIHTELTTQTQFVEGYLRDEALESFARRYLLTVDDNGDVTIYERRDSLSFEGRHAPDAVIAAELARSNRLENVCPALPRSKRWGSDGWRNTRGRPLWFARDTSITSSRAQKVVRGAAEWYAIKYYSPEAIMSAITATEARKSLFGLIQQVNDDHTVVEVVSRHGNAVILSKDDYDAMTETAYLLRNPANAERLLAAMDRARRGEFEQHDLLDA